MPTDTVQMKWNYEKHMYILDIEYLKKDLGLDFETKEGSKTRAKDKLYQISRMVFNYIYLHNSTNQKYIEYNIAFSDDLRPIIQEALEWQERYEYEADVLAMRSQIGINLLNGVVVDKKVLHGDRLIHTETYSILLVNGLLYSGRYNTNMQEQEFSYTDMEIGRY